VTEEAMEIARQVRGHRNGPARLSVQVVFRSQVEASGRLAVLTIPETL
jgi:hypothetical protein